MPVFQLTDTVLFPPTELAEENGLLAIGGNLSPERLVEAYRNGIFPWYSEGDPLLWWFTSPRLVIFPESFIVSKRLARYFRKPLFQITKDKSFESVIKNCATIERGDDEGTWITEEMQQAYINLHKLGYAHSIECWDNGQLAGGLYGIALDKVFFGESMFSVKSNASKIALVALVNYLMENGFKVIDCQMTTNHLLSLGAEEIDGENFSQLLKQHIKSLSPDGMWNNEKETDKL